MSVTIQGGKGRAGAVNLDHTLAKQYHQALRVLKNTLKLSGSIDMALMARVTGRRIGFRPTTGRSETGQTGPTACCRGPGRSCRL